MNDSNPESENFLRAKKRCMYNVFCCMVLLIFICVLLRFELYFIFLVTAYYTAIIVYVLKVTQI